MDGKESPKDEKKAPSDDIRNTETDERDAETGETSGVSPEERQRILALLWQNASFRRYRRPRYESSSEDEESDEELRREMSGYCHAFRVIGRTFSQSDSPLQQDPDDRIFYSDKKSKGKSCDKKDRLDAFLKFSAVVTKIRRRIRQRENRSDRKLFSDGEYARIRSYFPEVSRIPQQEMRTFPLKRSSSDLPVTNAKIREKLKLSVGKILHKASESRSETSLNSSETNKVSNVIQQTTENTEDAYLTDSNESKTLSSRMSNVAITTSAERSWAAAAESRSKSPELRRSLVPDTSKSTDRSTFRIETGFNPIQYETFQNIDDLMSEHKTNILGAVDRYTIEASRLTESNESNTSARLSDIAATTAYAERSPTGFTEFRAESPQPCLLLANISKSPAESTSGIEAGCSSIQYEVFQRLDDLISNQREPSTSGNEDGYNLEVSRFTHPERQRCLPETVFDVETSSSENSEISRIIDPYRTMSPPECYVSDTEETDSLYSDYSSPFNDQSQSPPQIVSGPRSETGLVFKIPPVKPESPGTSKNSQGSLKRVTPENKRSDCSAKRPTDFNVQARSAFYSFSSSRSSVVMRASRSLPNVNRPPRNTEVRRSMNLDNLAENRVVRSLFTGNINSDQSHLRSVIAASNRETRAVDSQNSGFNKVFNQNRDTEHVPDNVVKSSTELTPPKSKAGKKLIFSPSGKKTNQNKILQEESLELLGEISRLELQDPTTVAESRKDDTPPKRKGSTPDVPDCLSPKKLRPLSASDSQNVARPSKELEQVKSSPTKEVQKELPQTRSQASKSTSPKRKARDSQNTAGPSKKIEQVKSSPAKEVQKDLLQSPSQDSINTSPRRKAKDSQNIAGPSKKLEQAKSSPAKEGQNDLLQPPSQDSKNTSPKRKAEDLESNNAPEGCLDSKKDNISESTIKRTKLKPPTPSDETEDSIKLPGTSKDSNTENKEN